MADLLNSTGNSTEGQTLKKSENFTISTFFASLIVAFVVFGVQVLVFVIIKSKLPRIYQPRTYLVPEKERTKEPPAGLWAWAIPVFRTSNSDFIQKCGLDAYFFLRYLRLLLKLFIPMAAIIMPILIPLNSVGGKGPNFANEFPYSNDQTWSNVNGLNELSWSNVRPTHTNRYWAHLILALGVIVYSCYLFYDELRGFIRLRQAYLTSPQHRLRASATTVLVSAIPRKWCTADALDGLYDVFPGGIRNIWINRNYDTLNDKVNQRKVIAQMLESAQTELIKKAKSSQLRQAKKDAKKAGQKNTKQQDAAERKRQDEQAAAMAESQGISTGDPHQTKHTVHDVLEGRSNSSSRSSSPGREKRNPLVPIPILGEGLEAVGHGFNALGKTVIGGLRSVGKGVDNQLNTTQGFVPSSQEESNTRQGPYDLTTSPAYNLDHGSPESPRDHMDGAGSETELRRGNTTSFENSNRQHPYSGPVDSRINRQNLEPNDSTAPDDRNPGPQNSKFKMWGSKRKSYYDAPSPQPKGHDDGEFPLGDSGHHVADANLKASGQDIGAPESQEKSKLDFLKFWSKSDPSPPEESEEYSTAYDESYDSLEDGEPLWKKYLKPSDRQTMRLPIFGIKALWFLSSIPFVGRKVDTIDYCRKELARFNLEIESDQKHPEKYPLMNSAFIQFNHQVAAHMACQAVSHHVPNQMAPRTVEISPDDVIWENMSVKWWERYLRTAVVLIIIAALVIGWAVPVSFTALLANISNLAQNYAWLSWLDRIPDALISPIQGVLPQLLLAILLALLPIILRLLAKAQGVFTGMAVELTTQDFYFAFLFVQVFLVLTFSSGIINVFAELTRAPQNIAGLLAQNLPKASNYFFSYLLLQALSTSAGVLVQIMGLIGWFIIGPLFDSTARQKWSRQITLPEVNWGTFFPVYTNLAVIGLVYSIIAPLILIFNIITFALFWFVYRYNTLYVTKFRFDTGGLLFPKAINQLFTGLYVMELCLVGLFFLVRETDEDGSAFGTPCLPQGIIMIILFFFTVLYQVLLNNAFGPLFRYLPITLEDEAVMRDEEFARSQNKKFNLADDEREGDDINDLLEAQERRSQEEDAAAESIELKQIETSRRHRLDPRKLASAVPDAILNPSRASWADKSRRRSSNWATQQMQAARDVNEGTDSTDEVAKQHRLTKDKTNLPAQDAEAQRGTHALGHALFSGIHDEIEDLSPEDRDRLVQRAFQHQALRARRPVIWIPRDDLGVSDDEIMRTKKLSKHIWISNEFTGLDSRVKVVYRKSPPDFSEVDLIEL